MKLNKDINLYKAHQLQEQSQKRMNPEDKRLIKIIVSMLVIVLLVGGGMFAFSYYLQSETDRHINYLSQPDVVEKIVEVSREDVKLSSLRAVINESILINTIVKDYPRYDSSLWETILPIMNQGMTLHSVRWSQNQLMLGIKTPNSMAPSTAVMQLKQTGLFADVQYTGFQESPEPYSFTITMIVKGAE